LRTLRLRKIERCELPAIVKVPFSKEVIRNIKPQQCGEMREGAK
jgi:hypothetical protein